MLKPLVIVAMLTSPALADKPPDKAPEPLRVELQLRIGKDVRSNVINIVDHSCGRIEDNTPDHKDEIKACADIEGANVRLSLKWATQSGKSMYTNESSVVIAHGASIEIGKPDAKLVVKML